MQDLTAGTPWKKLTAFAAPIALGRLFQTMYSMADTKIVGMLLGKSALAAVSSVSTLCHLLNGFLGGTALGCAVIMAMYLGGDEKGKVRHSFALSLVFSVGTACLLTLLLNGFLPGVLDILQVPEEEKQMAGRYLIIILTGLPVFTLSCMFTQAVRSLGDSWLPLWCLGFSTILNVALDFVFIGYLRTGTGGAALATVLSQLLTACLTGYIIRKKHPLLHPCIADFSWDGELSASLLKSGCAMGFQSCIVNIGTVALQTAINAMGPALIVAHTAARRVFEMMYIPYASLGFALATYTASNYGAHRTDRIREGYRSAVQIILVWSLFVTAVGEFLPSVLIRFLSSQNDPEIILWGTRYLRVEMPALFICGIVVLTRNLLQGVGRRSAPVWSSVLELAVKVSCALASLRILHYWGIIWSEPLSWTLMSVLLVAALRRAEKEEKM